MFGDYQDEDDDIPPNQLAVRDSPKFHNELEDLPTCSCDEHFEIMDENIMLPSVSDLLDYCTATSAPVITPITPQPKKRKQQALALAATLSGKKAKKSGSSRPDADADIPLVKVFMTFNNDASRGDMTATGQLGNGETKRVSIFSTRKLPRACTRALGKKCKDFATKLALHAASV